MRYIGNKENIIDQIHRILQDSEGGGLFLISSLEQPVLLVISKNSDITFLLAM